MKWFSKKIPDVTPDSFYQMPPEWARHSHIYAILDAARNEKIYKLLMGCKEEYTCLYSGEIPIVLARVAPYLIKLPSNSDLFDQIYQEGFYDNWGVFFVSNDSSKELKRHFQKLLKVKTEDGRRLYFRYYDPRVLRIYLPTCTKNELTTFFGPVNKFWTSGERKETIIEFGKDKERFYVANMDMSDETLISIKKYTEES